MKESSPEQEGKKTQREKSVFQIIFDFFSSFGLAAVTMLLLLVLTWLGTLEQVSNGLHATVLKYFSWKSPIIFPEFGGKTLPIPLPGAFWVSTVLFINMCCGGIIRARKGWKTIGVLISHFGILFMLVGGAITHFSSERGNLVLKENQTADVAQNYTDYSIDIAEIVDGKIGQIQTIGFEHLDGLNPEDRRLFKLSDMPFDLEIMGFNMNTQPRNVFDVTPRNKEKIVDDFYLQVLNEDKQAERNLAGCYARPVSKEGESGEPFILTAASFQPKTINGQGRTFFINITKTLWPLPFPVRLDDFRVKFYPGTRRASTFESDVTRILDNGGGVPVGIKMNEPMRYKDYTFYQASWGPEGSKEDSPDHFSVLEVVRDPADQWPKWSLIVVSIGLSIHFGVMLVIFIKRAFSKPALKTS